MLQYVTYVGGGGYAWIMQGFAYHFRIYYIDWEGFMHRLCKDLCA